MHIPGTLSPRRWTPRAVKPTCFWSAAPRKVADEGDVVGEHDHLAVGRELGEPSRDVSAPAVVERCDRVVEHERRLAVVEVRLGEVAGEPEGGLLALAQDLLDRLGDLRAEESEGRWRELPFWPPVFLSSIRSSCRRSDSRVKRSRTRAVHVRLRQLGTSFG